MAETVAAMFAPSASVSTAHNATTPVSVAVCPDCAAFDTAPVYVAVLEGEGDESLVDVLVMA